jgi:hypothetical protein
MRTIWHSLAWKEWHEHKWKLAAITAVMWSVVAFVMLFSFWDRYVLATTQFAIISALVPMAVFIGASAAAGEQSHRTLTFLQSLPIPLWRVALLKLGFGAVSLVVPLLLTLGLVMVGCIILAAAGIDSRAIDDISESFISNDWRLSTILVGTLLAGSLLLWCAALGANRKDEVSAGAVALASILAWWLLLWICWGVLLSGSTDPDTARLRAIGIGSAYGGVFFLPDLAPNSTDVLIFGGLSIVMTHGLLAAWFVRQFGRTDSTDIRSPRGAALDVHSVGRLASPWRWPVTAIAWKQFRETGTLAVVAAICVVGACIVAVRHRVR